MRSLPSSMEKLVSIFNANTSQENFNVERLLISRSKKRSGNIKYIKIRRIKYICQLA